jgi:hypothetical protein
VAGVLFALMDVKRQNFHEGTLRLESLFDLKDTNRFWALHQNGLKILLVALR